MRFRWLLPLFLIFFACNKKPAEKVPESLAPSAKAAKELNILAPKSFREQGLALALTAEFEKEHDCKISISYFADADSLIYHLESGQLPLDLVLGLDNGLVNIYDLDKYFKAQSKEAFPMLLMQSLTDTRYYYIPYGYSYLALLYYDVGWKDAPQTFGALQNSIYRGQIALAAPASSAWGRALMHYLVALFGESGYAQLLGALLRNIQHVYSDAGAAINAVKRGEAGLTFAMYNTALWQNQLDFGDGGLKSQLLKEGSYLYTENMGILKKSPNKDMAEAFMQFILADYAQNMVLLKLGLMPVNSGFALPLDYSRLAPTVYTVNSRLDTQDIRENHAAWLKTWQQTIGK